MTLKIRLQTMILCSGIVLFGLMSVCRADATPAIQQTRITGIHCQQTTDAFLVTIRSDARPTYTMYELFNPLRVVVDIADATLTKSAGLPLQIHKGPVAMITGRILEKQKPLITRIEIKLAKDRAYKVERDGNDIKVKFTAPHTQIAAANKTTSLPIQEMAGSSKTPATAMLLAGVSVTAAPSATRVLLQTGKPISNYRKAELPRALDRPDRLYIDIPHLHMTSNFKHIQVGRALAGVRVAHRGTGLRVVFDSGLDGPFKYDIKTVPQGLLVTIPEPAAEATVAELIKHHEPLPPEKGKGSGIANIKPLIPAAFSTKTQAKKQEGATASVSTPSPEKTKASAPPDALALAGYHARRISVDFYKIDLQNVFRLIGKISGRNIVVDDAVHGTVTLSLHNVPWDFVLDVILNLKGLQKEERYNTIVISPKNKKYVWPKPPADNLAIAPNGSILRQEAISIKKKLDTPPRILDAKKLILQGNEQYLAGRYETALPLYEKAFTKWPQNKQLAERISALALGRLGRNAEAVHYAQAVLRLDPHDSEAALHAAIGLANMDETKEAKKYFDLAIAGSRPSSEALISYAAFCEDNDSYKAALTLLAKHEEIYGDTLESMVAKARLLDKLGRGKEATSEYRAVLLSGFKVPPDLARYIKERMAVANQ